VAERPPKPGPGPSRRSLGPPRASADENEPTRVPEQPGTGGPSLTGGPDREYRSGEIEPSQVIQAPAAVDGDWEEKTVVDDSQLYNTKDGPNTLNIGTITSDDELTIDEPNRSVSTALPRPAPGRPTPAPVRPAPAAGRPVPAPGRPEPITPTPAAQVPEAAQAKLAVIAGNDAGREFPLYGKTITVGRGIDNDVVLTDIAVSRKHMSIAFDGTRYYLEDKGSGNGTIINQHVETGTRLLGHADRIEIGNTVFRFEHPASEKQSWAQGAPASPAPPPPKGSGGKAASLAATLTAPPPPPSHSRPASPENSGLPLPPPHHGAGSGPPATLTGSSPVGDLAYERPQESAPLPEASAPWSPPPAPPPPAMASGIASAPAAGPVPGVALGLGLAAHPSPAFVPLVPRGPISGRKLLVGATATFAGLIAIAIAGMLIGGDQSLAGQPMEPPFSVEEMLFSWIAPVLELGDASGALPPGVDIGTGLGAGTGVAPGSVEPGSVEPDALPASTEPTP
jgi:pSer/pThr/pTyr-binding forkhead associated (FHA) protein